MKTIISFWLFLFAFGTTCFSQIINIPDVNFKNKLLQPNSAQNLQGQFVSVDTNGNGEIEVSEAHNVRVLNSIFMNSNISDLTGLEYFIYIKGLFLSFNQISQFNFPSLTLLESLHIGNNPISSLNVPNHPNIKILHSFDTQISELNFQNAPLLLDIGAGNQPLIAIDVSNKLNLILFKINNTNIKSINIKNTNLNFNHAGMLWDCWANIPLTYICCDAEDVPALTTFLTNCGHNLANITIDTTNTCALSNGKFENYNIAVYPNPSTGIFNLTLPEVFNAHVEVFNTLGQKVYNHGFENEQHVVLDLNHLQKGLYLLKVQNAQGDKFEEKIIIAP